MEIWAPKPPGTLWTTQSLLREIFTFFMIYILTILGICFSHLSATCITSSFHSTVVFIVSGFRHSVNEVLALLGSYETYIGFCYRRFDMLSRNVGK